MSQSLKRIAVTGAAGQIAYNLLFRIASGEMLGDDQKIALHLLEIPQAQEALKGVLMELNDCAFPLLEEVVIGSDPREVFQGVDLALLVGSKPRGPGMERSDLLQENGKIFVQQGKALNDVASRDVKVLVVGNPCNTNCLIAMHHAPKIPRKNFHAMTRLDHNRLIHQLAHRAQVNLSEVTGACIWGNHSPTQVPDFYHVKIANKKVLDVLNDEEELKSQMVQTVQKRGGAVIKARGKSSAASAANAVIDSVKSIYFPTKSDQWFSSGVCSDHNSYGIEEDLIFSFPCSSKGNGDYEIVDNLAWNDFIEEKIRMTEKELIKERDAVKDLL